MNYCWVATALSLIAITIYSLVYYCTVVNYCNLSDFSMVGSLTIVSIYACFFYEKRLKLYFIQLQENKQMHEDMGKVFDNIPEGVVILSRQTHEVKLANQEFKKLFRINEGPASENN